MFRLLKYRKIQVILVATGLSLWILFYIRSGFSDFQSFWLSLGQMTEKFFTTLTNWAKHEANIAAKF